MKTANVSEKIRNFSPHKRVCIFLLVFFLLFFLSAKTLGIFIKNAYIQAALKVLLPISVTLLLYFFTTKSKPEALRIKNIKFSSAMGWFFLGICADCALTIINIPFNKLWSFLEIENTAIVPAQNFLQYILGILCIAVIPAVFEELFCRGMILHEYEEYNKGVGIVASSLIFVMAHNSLTNAVCMLILAFVLAFIVFYTDSLLPAIIFHFAVNFFSFAASYISENILAPHLQLEVSLLTNLFFIILALTFFIIIFILLKKWIKKIMNENKTEEKPKPPKHVMISLIFIFLIYIFFMVLYLI